MKVTLFTFFLVLLLSACGKSNEIELFADNGPAAADSGLIGGGGSRLLAFNPSPVNFAAVGMGIVKVLEVVVTNVSQASQEISSVAATNNLGSPTAWLKIESNNECIPGLMLQPGDDCTLRVSCSPQGIGAIEGSESFVVGVLGGADQSVRAHCISAH